MAVTSDSQFKQGLNPYNILVLCFLGLGSITYGYTASIIGTTLGTLEMSSVTRSNEIRSTIFHCIFRARYSQEWYRSYCHYEWSVSSWRCGWHSMLTLVRGQIWSQVGLRLSSKSCDHFWCILGRISPYWHVHCFQICRWCKCFHDLSCGSDSHERDRAWSSQRCFGRFTRGLACLRICDPSMVRSPGISLGLPS